MKKPCRVARLSLLVLVLGCGTGGAAGATRLSGRLLYIELGGGYGGGGAEGIEGAGPSVMLGIGLAEEKEDFALAYGPHAMLAGTANDFSSLLGEAGASLRLDFDLEDGPQRHLRWAAAFDVGYAGATGADSDTFRSGVGFGTFTGVTAAFLNDAGSGLALSAGPYALVTTHVGAAGGVLARMRLTIGPL